MEGEVGEACVCALIHLASSAGRGVLRHRSSPPVWSWPLDEVAFQVFLDVFSDMLQTYISSVSVVLDVCFNCFMRML
jgi:hypothetical protein